MIRFLSITLLTFLLIACDGLDLDTIDSSSDDFNFSDSELNGGVLFSALVLDDSDIRDRNGFITLFKSSSVVEEIELRSADIDGRALVDDYTWDIVNEKLQVSYPSSIVCTSTKTGETSTQISASSTCDGGEPTNDRIQGTLLKPVSFNNSNLTTRTIFIEKGNNDVEIEFKSGGAFEITNVDSLGIRDNSTTQNGTYNGASGFTNVVKLDNTDATPDEFSYLILLDGNLNSGTMLELRYQEFPQKLIEVRIYSIDANDKWKTESLYDDITTDS